MSITFEDDQGNPVYSPLRAAELANKRMRVYMSARISDNEEVETETPYLTPLRAAAIAAEMEGKTRSACVASSFKQWCDSPLEQQLRNE